MTRASVLEPPMLNRRGCHYTVSATVPTRRTAPMTQPTFTRRRVAAAAVAVLTDTVLLSRALPLPPWRL